MAETENPNPFSGDQVPKVPAGDEGTYTQKFNHAPVAARVPEKIARGVFSTGVLIQDGPGEFVLDFLQALSRPPQIAARVVLSPIAMQSFVNSLRENLGNFTKTFGTPQPLPKPANPNRPSIQELYEHFKLPEELVSGVYANSFVISHAPAEFVFDFITGFYPTASVSARTYLSAQQVPRLLDTLTSSLAQHQQRFGGIPQPPQQNPPPQQPPAPPEPHG